MNTHIHFIITSISLLLLSACMPPPVSSTLEPNPYPNTGPNAMVHTDGTKIVDGNGQPIHLRGVLLEGWLQWNGTLWGAGLTSESTITERLEALVGPEETERFRQKVYENFIVEDDIKRIAALGFNVVRIPFNHRLLEDDEKPYVYKASGWQHLDRVLNWCERHTVYAVLDFHSVPGGQSNLFVSDPDNVKLWDSEENMKRTVALWKEIALRYRDRKVVAGYDLLNEPEPPNGQALVDAYLRIIEAVREVDPHHMIILEGGAIASNDFSMFEKALCPNQVYSFHTYNLFGNDVGKPHLQELTRMSIAMGVPLWNGEFGAHTDVWIKELVGIFEDPNSQINGWIFWPWKRVAEADTNRYRHLMEIKSTPKWDLVRTYCASLFGMGKKPSREDTLEGMQAFLEALKPQNLILDQRTLDALNSYK